MSFPLIPGSRDPGGSVPPRRRARGRVALVAAVTALALGASACGGSDSDDKGGSDGGGTGAPRQGGKMTIPLPVESRGLDPFTASYTVTADGSRMAALYDFLVWLDPKTGAIEPRIAESLKPDANGGVWTLKLKPGVMFTDDTPFDAAAVKANWDAHLDPKMQSLHKALLAGVTTEVVGPLELKITLAEPSMSFDRTVAYGLTFIASPTAFKADPAGFISKPVGAGPFTLKEWVRGSHQTMVRNTKYWEKDKGLPHLDEVSFSSIADEQQILNTISTGGADMTITTNGQAAVNAKAKNLKADATVIDGGQFFMFNTTRPPFDDPRARRAVAMAMDPDALMKTIFNGDVKAPKSIFRSDSPLVDHTVAEQPKYNQAEAQKLFDELAAEGKPVHFTFLTQQHTTARKTGEYMQSRLNQYKNVKMELESVEIGAYITKGLVQRDFQAQNYGMWQADPDPAFDTLLRSDSPANYSGYKSEAMDKALDAARAATTPEQRKQAYTAVAAQLKEDMPLWVWQEPAVTIVRDSDVTGARLVNEGSLVMHELGLTG